MGWTDSFKFLALPGLAWSIYINIDILKIPYPHSNVIDIMFNLNRIFLSPAKEEGESKQVETKKSFLSWYCCKFTIWLPRALWPGMPRGMMSSQSRWTQGTNVFQCFHFLDTQMSIAPAPVCPSVILSDFHSVSVPETSQCVERTLRWPPWWLTW